MSKHIDDGVPAFPQPMAAMPSGEMYCAVEKHTDFGGMTLRDWFAGKALAGLLTQLAEDEYGADHFAKASYEMADAMIRARKEA